MGYIYRPKLKSSGSRVLSNGTVCRHAQHGRIDECPACGARFCKTWWMKYYVNGVARRESTGATGYKDADKLLKQREGKAAGGDPVLPHVDRIVYEEAAQDLRQYYLTTGGRDIKECEYLFKTVGAFFRGVRIARISGDLLTRFVAKRQADGAANASINRELSLLSKMLRLAHENRKLMRMPAIHKLKEAAPRAGFFERAQFEAVKRHLRPDLQVAVSIAYAFGWRMQSEILALRRNQVSLDACTIRLEPGTTKNDEGRTVYMTPELVDLLRAQEERVQLLEMQLGRKVAWLFPYFKPHAKMKAGDRIRDFRKAWLAALVEATLDQEGLVGEEREQRRAALAANPGQGLLGMLRHDFRRTAVRNMVNRGVPERVAMKITGHKTRAVFDRYHIVSPGDLQEAARKLTGTFSGTLPEQVAARVA